MRGTPSSWSTSTSSVEPPPMSKISAGPSPGSSNLWQPSTASRASSCGSMMSSAMPVSSRTRSTNSRPLAARRQASVATERDSETLRRRSLSAHTAKRGDRAVHRLVRQPAALGQPFAEADDARESVDDGEALVGRAGRSAGGNCWCRGRSRHRCGAGIAPPQRLCCRWPCPRHAARAAGPAHWRLPAP